MTKMQGLDELILNNDFQTSMLKQTQIQKQEALMNTMTMQEIDSRIKKEVHFSEVAASRGKAESEVQCEILSMKKFRKLNEILVEKDLIIEHMQE